MYLLLVTFYFLISETTTNLSYFDCYHQYGAKKCNKTRLFFNLEGQMLLLQIIIIIFFYIFLILYIVRVSETGIKPLASFPGLFRSECKQMLFFLDKVHLYSGTCLIRHTKGTGKCVGL